MEKRKHFLNAVEAQKQNFKNKVDIKRENFQKKNFQTFFQVN